MSLLMSAKWDVCVISDSSRSWVRGCYPAVYGVPQPQGSSWPLYRSWVHWPSTIELCPQPAAAQVILTTPKNCLYKYKTQLFIQQLATHFLKKKIKSSNFQSPIYKNVQFCYSFIFAIITYHSFHLLNPRNWTALNFHKLNIYVCDELNVENKHDIIVLFLLQITVCFCLFTSCVQHRPRQCSQRRSL